MKRIDRRAPAPQEPVRVSMNLHLKLLAIRGRRGEDRGRVLRHTAEDVALVDVRFFVSESGLQRVREKGCREVIAWALGDYVPSLTPEHLFREAGSSGEVGSYGEGVSQNLFSANGSASMNGCNATFDVPDARAGFNPFRHDHFTTGEGRGVASAQAAIFRIEHPQVILYRPQYYPEYHRDT